MRKLLLIIFLFFSFNAHSLTYGSYSCGDILSWERTNNETQIYLTKLFIAGFVMGYNSGRTFDETELFPNTDDETMWYLLVNECKRMPQQDSIVSMYKIMINELARIGE